MSNEKLVCGRLSLVVSSQNCGRLCPGIRDEGIGIRPQTSRLLGRVKRDEEIRNEPFLVALSFPCTDTGI